MALRRAHCLDGRVSGIRRGEGEDLGPGGGAGERRKVSEEECKVSGEGAVRVPGHEGSLAEAHPVNVSGLGTAGPEHRPGQQHEHGAWASVAQQGGPNRLGAPV